MKKNDRNRNLVIGYTGLGLEVCLGTELNVSRKDVLKVFFSLLNRFNSWFSN